MDHLVWRAALRFAGLSLGALALVGTLLVRDAFQHRCPLIAVVAASSSASLLLGALVAMKRVRSFFSGPQPLGPALDGPYRRGARHPLFERSERDRTRAVRCASAALVALAVAGAFAVVAAAAR
jgi:hypothetical protein